MHKIRVRGEQARRFILDNIEDHPNDIARQTAQRLKISRQAVNRHLDLLVKEGALFREGNTRARVYRLCPLVKRNFIYPIDENLAEDVVWRTDIEPVLGNLPANVMEIWYYGFTEMFNNAIDHSGGRQIRVQVEKTAAGARMLIDDDGVGIFKKIQKALGLLDERHAVLELAKGKLTTDPRNHSGEGIFFSSRMFDEYGILSGETYFTHSFGEQEDWIMQNRNPLDDGTTVFMRLNNHTSRTQRKVFDEFTSPDTIGFTKTVVPVRLAQYGDDQLISRSQAKRLLARVDRFSSVVFDFRDVAGIGQAFADEIFRVFANQHPNVELVAIHANAEVHKMVDRARTNIVE